MDQNEMQNEIIGAGVFANVLYDEAFKVVVARKGNEPLLIDILELLIPGKKISSLSIESPEQHGLVLSDKNLTFDLLCKSKDPEEEFLVEMQFSPQATYPDRMLSYATMPIRLQMSEMPKGTMNYRLRPLYVISIVNFALNHKSEDALKEGLLSSYSILNDRNGEMMTNALHFVYLELGRLKLGVNERSERKSPLEEFAWDLKYGHWLKDSPDKESDLQRRFYSATKLAALTQDQLTKYERAMRTHIDELAIKEYARQEGLEEGREEGREEGLAEGMKAGARKRSIEIARALLKEGVKEEIIVSSTGLTPEEVKGLAK